MFDTGRVSARPRPEIPLAVLGERARPVTLAAERALPVTSVLAPLLPDGGLPRGATVGVHGPGATALALALVAAASGAGSWTAVVGADDLGLVAAAEAGLALERTVVVADPPPAAWSTVVAALVESVEVVLVRASRRVAPGEQRRLRTHLRRRGGVLVRLPGPGSWPEPADVALRASSPGWEGAVGVDRIDGAGRLLRRRLVVIDVDTRSGDDLVFQRPLEIGYVDHGTARGIDENGTRFDPFHRLMIDDVMAGWIKIAIQ